MTEAQILIPGRIAEDHEIGKNARLWLNRIAGNGWETRVGYSQAYYPPKVYAGGQKAGQEYGEETVDQVWIQAIHYDRKKKLSVTFENDKFKFALWGVLMVSSQELLELIKGTWEEPLPSAQFAEWKAVRAEKNRRAKNG